jgi:DNA-binding response OmpR family regulator
MLDTLATLRCRYISMLSLRSKNRSTGRSAMPIALIVEDDASIADIVRLYVAREGYEIEILGDGLLALERVERPSPPIGLVILDLMLPGMDGRGVCRRIRKVSDVPIIMLTALDDERDTIEGLDLGADDYVTKPFNPNELMARIRAVMRRRSAIAPANAQTNELVVGALHLDLERRTLHVGGAELSLRTREFDLLAHLARRPGIVFSREHLLELVWAGELHDNETRTVDVHISRLRDRLASTGCDIRIETIRSVGYRLAASGLS